MPATFIDGSSIKTLRADVTAAVQAVMAKHGLTASLGRITYEPGREFRGKLTVIQAAPTSVKSNPVVGESWNYNGKVYRIVSYSNLSVIGERYSNSRKFGRLLRRYRIKRDSFTAIAYKVS